MQKTSHNSATDPRCTEVKKSWRGGTEPRRFLLILLGMLGIHTPLLAGGGGQNLLLVVNPGDEQQVRIAVEYQRLRHIPDCNMVFIEPRIYQGFYRGEEDVLTNSLLITHYFVPVHTHIQSNNLSAQIDYIAALGMPFKLNNTRSVSFLMGHLDGIVNGTKTTSQYGGNTRYFNLASNTYHTASNTAMYHSNDGLYVSSVLGFTGIFGNSPNDIIAGLRRTAGADGSKPVGTIYFEESTTGSDPYRSRKNQWPVTKTALTARGIPYLESTDTQGKSPKNRSDVRGAVIGAAYYTIPNGSTYLPGSWADSMTSFGCHFMNRTQTKASQLIRVGAGGSSGTVHEPMNSPVRFPRSHIFIYQADGATLGEAFYRATDNPDLQMMLGDPLGQAYADVPQITLTSGPAEGAVVSGTVLLTATASLSSPMLATDIDRIDRYVDGKYAGTTTNSGTWNLNTSALSDGRHELRVVAVNNAAAESQALLIRNVMVNNTGRSVSITGSDLNAGTQSSLAVPVTSVSGSGSISRIELRHLGRTVGQLASGAGNVTLDVTKLAYGTNTVIPVAVFSDGAQVAGIPVQVNRDPLWLEGATPSPLADRVPGILGEYFVGQGGSSIAASTFSGTPDVTNLHAQLMIGVYSGANYNYTAFKDIGAEQHPVGNPSDPSLVNNLSARYSGKFEAKVAGEYNFFFYLANDSGRLVIDGYPVMEFTNLAGGLLHTYAPPVFLAKGEHTLELLSANRNTGTKNGFFDVLLYYRGPDGIVRVVNNALIYQNTDTPDNRKAGLLFLLHGDP
jgi:uncharacterized protein (TIGR03790 family)